MRIVVNGDGQDVMPDTTLDGLIREFHLKPENTLVQRNDDVVDRKDFSETRLEEGDRVELVRVVAGG